MSPSEELQRAPFRRRLWYSNGDLDGNPARSHKCCGPAPGSRWCKADLRQNYLKVRLLPFADLPVDENIALLRCNTKVSERPVADGLGFNSKNQPQIMVVIVLQHNGISYPFPIPTREL